MPTYDYQCRDCGHTFEVFQNMTAPKLSKCPRCRGRLKRLVGTGAGLIFKGSGFYATDYRSKSYREAEKKEKEGSKPKAASAPESSSPKKGSDSTPTATRTE